MSEYWNITASLEKVWNRRIILYTMHEINVAKQASPNLGDILFYCQDECRLLFEDLQGRKADKKNLEYVRRELELLKEFGDKWKTEHKKGWVLNQEP